MVVQNLKGTHNNRTISPPKCDWDNLRQPLEVGERQFIEYLDEILCDDWEIYIQPALNGLCPDIIILNPNIGICIFEVKNWDFDKIKYQVYEEKNGKLHLQGTSKSQGTFKIHKNPVDQLLLYRKEMRQIYCPQIDTESGAKILFCGLVFPSATRDQIKDNIVPIFYSRGRNLLYDTPNSKYFIFTKENFELSLKDSFPQRIISNRKNNDMNEKIAEFLRFWLVEPDASKEQRLPLELDKRQLEIATTRTSSGYRRLKGPAGSGKSLIVAKKASLLAQKSKRVLVVTFNITLINYLTDLAVRDYIKARKEITWLNFHFLASRICLESGFEEEYNNLFINHKDESFINNDQLCNLVEHALNTNDFEKFDAILVDEGQDYNPRWWSILRRILNENGEMLLVADTTQDIYGNGLLWTEQAMKESGFSGNWATLDNTYRLPIPIIPMIQDFAKKFIPKANIVLPMPPQNSAQGDIFSEDRSDGGNFIFRWIQVPSLSSQSKFFNNLKDNIDNFQNDVRSLGMSSADQTFLTTTHESGEWLTNLLKKKEGSNKVTDIFSPNWKEQRRKKQYFFKGSQSIKACTIHSYKGWETKALFIIVNRLNFNYKDAEILYTALTRIKGGSKCVIYIVCSDHKLDEFGEHWNQYFNSIKSNSTLSY